ncbi:restriction endonuclease subunit S [Gammaproteobacteria bacterium]|nr:restriction endonuclease subunit S [Gammaproteobacteria bacterium]
MGTRVSLQQVTDRIGDGLHGTPKYSETGDIPFINGNNLKSGRIAVDGKTKYVCEDEYEKHAKSLNERTVLLSINGTIGNVAQYRGEKIVLGKSACYLKCNEEVDPRFLVYLLKDRVFQGHIRQTATGTTIKNVSLALVREYEFDLPNMSDQKAIAHILGTLDDKIELNQKMNQTLEEIAKAIFKSWFVDFDPVRAKAEGRPTGLPPEISDLFPGELVDSEIGEIPKGWIIEEGRHLYSHQKGLSYKGQFLSDEDDDLPMLNLGSFAGNGKYRRKKLKFYCGEFKDRHQIYKGDLLVANTDLTQDRLIIGSPILVPDTPNESDFYLHTHHTTKITPIEESGLTTTFIYFTFLQDSFRQRVSGFATGTTVLALPKDTFDALQVVIPSAPVRSRFEEVAIPILSRCSLLAKEIEVLAELRDTLLPKLISGELRIPHHLFSFLRPLRRSQHSLPLLALHGTGGTPQSS